MAFAVQECKTALSFPPLNSLFWSLCFCIFVLLYFWAFFHRETQVGLVSPLLCLPSSVFSVFPLVSSYLGLLHFLWLCVLRPGGLCKSYGRAPELQLCHKGWHCSVVWCWFFCIMWYHGMLVGNVGVLLASQSDAHRIAPHRDPTHPTIHL